MNKADVVVFMGTRPEAIKLAPVVLALRAAGIGCHIVASGQHRDLLGGALASFELAADENLDCASDNPRLDLLVARAVERFAARLAALGPRFVLVQGDTATTVAGAWAAFHAKVPCAHVEAGLRSGRRDAPWPEEVYRQLVDRLCARLYAPTEGARENLVRENLDSASIVVTGQTGVDAALWMAQRVRNAPPALPRVAADSRVIYATAHRREAHERLGEILTALTQTLASFKDVEVVMPIHPNPVVRAAVAPWQDAHPRLHLTAPLDYATSVAVLSRASLVVTDSGGLQEEAPSFGIPIIVTREVTERPEAVTAGFARIAGLEWRSIADEIHAVLSDGELHARLSRVPNPFGDGNASRRIAADIARSLSHPCAA